MLDVGCGWGSFAVHAAEHHGVHVTGITLSEPQAAGARERAEAAGVADRVEIRVMDYRELRGEHVRRDRLDRHGRARRRRSTSTPTRARSPRLLEPGGRLLNHGIARLRHGEPEAGPFSERYVFPDAAPLHLSRVQSALERAASRRATSRASARTTRRRCANGCGGSRSNHDEAVRLAGPERMRVWQVYLRAARRGFETGFTSIYQVLADRA